MTVVVTGRCADALAWPSRHDGLAARQVSASMSGREPRSRPNPIRRILLI